MEQTARNIRSAISSELRATTNQIKGLTSDRGYSKADLGEDDDYEGSTRHLLRISRQTEDEYEVDRRSQEMWPGDGQGQGQGGSSGGVGAAAGGISGAGQRRAPAEL